MFNQMSAQNYIKFLVEITVSGIMKKYTELYNMNVFAKVNPYKLSRDNKKQSLCMMMLIK